MIDALDDESVSGEKPVPEAEKEGQKKLSCRKGRMEIPQPIKRTMKF